MRRPLAHQTNHVQKTSVGLCKLVWHTKKNHHKTNPMMHRTSSVYNGHRQISMKKIAVRRSHFSTQLVSQTHDSLTGHTWQHEYRRKNLVSETHRTKTSPNCEEDGKALSSRNNFRAKAKCLKQFMKITTTESENTDNTPTNAMDKTFCGRDENRDCNFLTKRKSRAGPSCMVCQIWYADEAACII